MTTAEYITLPFLKCKSCRSWHKKKMSKKRNEEELNAKTSNQ